MSEALEIVDAGLLQEICDQVAGEINSVVTIVAGGGEIVASSRRSRIGDIHPLAAAVMAGESNALEVTAAEAAANPVMLEGALLPIDFDGRRVFCVGVASQLEIAKPYARMIQLWVISLLRERALQRSEERFRDVAESAGDWIWEMNEDLLFTYLSPRFYEILRLPSDSILGKTRGELAAAEFDPEEWRAHEEKLAARLPFRDFSYIARTPDGSTRHLKIHGKPIYGANGNFRGYRGTGYDVTEQVEMKEALERSQRLLFDAIETIPEGFSLYDENDRLVVFNSKYHTMIFPGADIQLVAGMSFETIVREVAQRGYIPEAQGRIEEWVKHRLALRSNLSEPYIQERENDRWLLVSEHRTRDGGTVALYSDITEIKQREKELADKTEALERLASQLAKYLSPQVYESIFTGRREVKVASQRKKLTVFFSDISGFTEVADRLESEELTQLLNNYLTEMSRIALDYGATIDKYVGDGIVIFFGDPGTQGVKQDALNCVKMAIAMRDRMRALGHEWRNNGLETPLKCRIGINTGFCTVGNFGSEDRMDYTIIGGGVNLAARLERAASPEGILISYETYALVRDEIQCSEHGQITVKGVPYPVTTYEVIDTYENSNHRAKVISEDHPNLKLNIDLDAISPDERKHAAQILRQALDEIEGR